MIPLLFMAAFAAIALGMMLNTAFIPSPQDTALQMENAITKTATYAGTTLDLGLGYAPGGVGAAIGAVVKVSAIDYTTGDESYTMQLFESSNNSSFTACGQIITVSGATGAQVLTVPGFVSNRYIRLTLTLGGTTPSISLSAWANPNISV